MAAPSTAILDDFNRANEGPPPSSSWTAGLGTNALVVLSNQCANGSGQSGGALWGTATTADCEVYATAAVVPSAGSDEISLWARYVDSSSHYRVRWLADDVLYLWHLTTELGTYSIPSASNGDKIALQCIGAAISVWYKPSAGAWAEVISVTNASTTEAGDIGLSAYDTNVRMDDFGGGSLCEEITSASISGDDCAEVDGSETYVASVLPATATATDWTWSSDGLQSGQGTTTAVYLWETGGEKTVTCTVTNDCSDDFVGTKAVSVGTGSIREDIYAIVSAITSPSPGNVYDYFRWAVLYPDFLDKFKVTIGGENVIRACMVEAGTFTSERLQFHSTGKTGSIRPRLFYIHAYLTWNDADETEKTAEALGVAIADALDNSDVLHGACFYYHAEPAQLVSYEARMFGNVLCHYVRIQQTVTEYVE